MGYRRDRGGRKTRRLMVATALSVVPVIHGCIDDGGENIIGNPKGDFYDRALVDAAPEDAAADAEADAEIDYLVFSNPKGSFFDEGLVEPDASTDDAAGADRGDGDGGVDAGDGEAGDGEVGDGFMDGDGTGGASGM